MFERDDVKIKLDNKLIGAIVSVIGILGTIASIAIVFIIEPCCILFMNAYHQILVILVPIFIAILTIGLYLYFKKEKIRKISKATKIEKILTPDERKVINFLKGKKEVTQADLRRESGMSKAKLSMLLEKMQQRKIVKKVKIGKTNIVIPMKGF